MHEDPGTRARRLPRRRGKGLHEDRGQAAFEFLLILPFFILFVVLLIDFGILMYEYVSVSNAVREGARYAAVNCPATPPDPLNPAGCNVDKVQQRTVNRSGGILTDPSEVAVGWPSGVDRGSPVAVKVTHPYTFLFFPMVTFDVVSCADMRLEQQDSSATAGGSGC